MNGPLHLCAQETRLLRLEGKALVAERYQASLLADFRALEERLGEHVAQLGAYVAQLDGRRRPRRRKVAR